MTSFLTDKAHPNETHLPPLESSPPAHPRFSRAHAHPGRSRCDQRPPRQGPPSIGCLGSGPILSRLPRVQRLSGQDRFRALLRTPAVERKRFVEAFARPNHAEFARLGIVVGRKAARRAVDRNQRKRWVRERFRALHLELAGLDVVVRFRLCGDKRTSSDVRPEINDVLSAIARCRNSLLA
jgi:ribonuclease P protein component